ncbi:MAG: M20 family metallopeptidase [Puniceicoccaceae bacterium]
MSEFNLKTEIDDILPEVLALRHDLHQHPETAYEEKRTAGKVVEFLSGLDNIDVQTGIGGTGVLATIGGSLDGPCVALRADMDALPIEEESGVPWSSTIPGKMHACGHDGHTAMLAGAARILARNQDLLAGPVKCIFQPAEEGGAGARAMREEGILQTPDVDAIFGLHNNLPSPEAPFGKIAYCKGAAMAGTGTFDITIQGVGGHAAFPHRCVDPIYIGSCVVEQLQGIISRRLDPVASGVLSVTRFEAGSAYNIIPPKAKLAGTIRALDDKVLQWIQSEIYRCVDQVCAAHGASADVQVELCYPTLVNDPTAEACFLALLEETGDTEKLMEVEPIMGGEDFAFYGQQVPAFFYFLPSCSEGCTDNPVCHSPRYDFNDDLLPTGIRLQVEMGMRFARLWKH